ncbi:hypothetical protein FACS1894137_16520 [Spirochaetia bacterium]|nr:hypothetical protein FACS1894137_16520 [Spirochaetia bacterium]
MSEEGVELIVQNGGKQTRQIQTTSGKLSIQRTVQVPQILVKDESGRVHYQRAGKPIVPFDEYLHIADLPFKMSEGMMRETASWGQSQISYKMAEEMMKEKCGYEVSSEYIRQVTDYIGGQLFEKDQENAENLDKNR